MPAVSPPSVRASWPGHTRQAFTGDLAFDKTVTLKVRGIDRYKRTVAEMILAVRKSFNRDSSSNLRPPSIHFMQIFAVRPAPDLTSCGVSFRQTLQKRSVRGSGSPFDAYPGQ
jgi:hypothetical protein